ncbi:MAG: hypothetical protein AAF327_22530 [Cyanobacteria bacterium P01_A01_bin.37]
MAPIDVIRQLVTILLNSPPPVSEDAIYDALARAGISDRVADRAYKFAQIAHFFVVMLRNLPSHVTALVCAVFPKTDVLFVWV